MSQAGTLGNSNSSSSVNSVVTDFGTATPIANILQIHGGNNITTLGSTNVVTVEVSGTTNDAPLIGNASGSITSIGPLLSGQLLIGSTGNPPVAASLTAGSNITITPGPGSITIASTGGGGGSVISVSGTAGQIDSTGGTTPVISIDAAYVGQTSITTLGTITTGHWNGSLIPLAYGGTNANLTASNGGIFYSTATAGAILSGTATANQVLLSGSSTTPAWSTNTYPSTDSKGDILYASAANVIGGLGIGSTGNILTIAAGLPAWTTNTYPSTDSKGDILYASAANTISGLGIGSTGNILTIAAGLPAWTTSTYPSTNAVSTLLYASSANVMAALATANDGVLITSNSGVPSWLANSGTAGWVLTANTAAPPSWQAPGAGSAGTITGDSGGAISQSAGNWNLLGTANQITTTGSGSTITWSLPSAITAPGSLTTTTTLTSGTLFEASAGQVVNRTATAISYNVLATDYIIAVTDTTAVRTITLLSAPTTNQVFIIKDETGAASINNISITVSGGSITIDGLTTQKLNTNYGAAAVYFNGTNYFFL